MAEQFVDEQYGIVVCGNDPYLWWGKFKTLQPKCDIFYGYILTRRHP